MKAATGRRTARRRCRLPVASSNRTTPKAATRIPAISAAMSMRLAICARPVDALESHAWLDPELTEADVGVDCQLRRAGGRATDSRPVAVAPGRRPVEPLGLARTDVGRARHAHVRRDEELRLTYDDPQVNT